MPALGEAAHITSGDDNSLDGRAKRLWFEIVQECTRRKIPIKKSTRGQGYLWSGSLAAIAGQVWPNLLREGRMGSQSQQFVADVRNHLKQNKNIAFEQTRGQMWISAKYNEPKKKAIKVAVARDGLGVSTLEISIPDQAKAVWAKARSHAQDKGCVTEEYEGVLFWKVEKPLSYFIHAVFPDLHAFEGGRAPIYDFLRSTCNAVNISHDPTIDSEHAWLIRDTWNEGNTVILFRSVPDRIDQRAAKLTPHEAGEDREPAPVEVRHIEEVPMTEPTDPPKDFPCPEPNCDFVGISINAVNAHSVKHKRPEPMHVTSGYITLPDGRVKCDECDATFAEAGSIPGHKKQHYNERREQELARLERENRRLRAMKSGDINLTVEAALRTLHDRVDEATGALAKVDRLNEQVSKLREDKSRLQRELTEQKRITSEARRETAESANINTFVELLQGIVDAVNSGRIAPIRGLADVDDLLRSMREMENTGKDK